MITPGEIEKKTMTPEKRKEARGSYFAFYVGRPLSYALTIPFLYTNISPNTVTVLSILCSLAGFAFLSLGRTTAQRLAGLMFFFLWNMGDGIDGNIARYKNVKSANGDLLDTLGGYLAMVLILLAMGNAAYFDQGGWRPADPAMPVMLSALSAAAALIPRLLMHRKLALHPEKAEAAALKDKGSYGLAKTVVLNLCDPAGFQEVVMLICIVLSLNTQFTVLYFVLNVCMMLYSIMKLLERE